MTKASELRDLTPEELEGHLADSQKELFNLRFQLATGRLDNVSRIPHVRREIARLKTVIGERAAAAGRSGKEE